MMSSRKLALIAGGSFLAVAAVLFGVEPSNSPWHVEIADTEGGLSSSLRLDRQGNAHVAHHDPVQHLLKYSFYDHLLKKWFTAVIDTQCAGFCSLVLDSHERPAISYIEYGTGNVKYAHWTGDTWKKQAIPLIGKRNSYYTSIALDDHDRPTITFYTEYSTAEDRLRLRALTWTGSEWNVRTVDADEGSGKFNSIGTNSAGYTEIAYGNVEYTNASLRYACWNGRSWDIEVLEGKGRPGTSMWSVMMTLDAKDIPHIAYTDVRQAIVKYATKRNGQWTFTPVDALARVGYPDRNGIALDEAGSPMITYHDAGKGVLKAAYLQGNRWVADVVDDQDGSGFNSSAQIRDGVAWITYADGKGRLKCARRRLGPAVPKARVEAK